MIGALKQVEAGRKVEDVAREVGVSKHTLYAWKAKYSGMDVSQAQEAKQLQDENTRLRKLVADRTPSYYLCLGFFCFPLVKLSRSYRGYQQLSGRVLNNATASKQKIRASRAMPMRFKGWNYPANTVRTTWLISLVPGRALHAQ